MRWTNYLAWASAPLVFGFLNFAFLCLINWPYESKLIVPRVDPGLDPTSVYLGPILLAGAVFFLVLAGVLSCLVGHFWPLRERRAIFWFAIAPLSIFAFLFLTLPGLNIIWLGPAAITMLEQTKNMPH